MTEPEHTQGPWKLVFDNKNNTFCIWNQEKDFLIASIAKGEASRPNWADLRLLTGAWQLPDLREENAELKAIIKEMISAVDEQSNLCTDCKEKNGIQPCYECPWYQARDRAEEWIKEE